jgi:hypothetical protein
MAEGYCNHTFECKATSLAKTTCVTPSLSTTPKGLELAGAALINSAKMENLSHQGQISYQARGDRYMAYSKGGW